LFDPSRAPTGHHTAWAYCHVPNGSSTDCREAIESQIERFAPGFRDCIVARSTSSPLALERWNPNLIGGDLSAGVMNLRQLLFRPTASLYRTPMNGLYLCGASTPPGGGVHGMSGFHAAQMATRYLKRRRLDSQVGDQADRGLRYVSLNQRQSTGGSASLPSSPSSGSIQCRALWKQDATTLWESTYIRAVVQRPFGSPTQSQPIERNP